MTTRPWQAIELHIPKSPMADTRTCNYADVSREALLDASLQHIRDVNAGMAFFARVIMESALKHDFTKVSAIDQFHADFMTGFEQKTWWDAHRKMERHHLAQEDGVREDVNLIDVLEYISDCIMAGMARKGEIYPLEMTPELLLKAFHNTVEILACRVKVLEEKPKKG